MCCCVRLRDVPRVAGVGRGVVPCRRADVGGIISNSNLLEPTKSGVLYCSTVRPRKEHHFATLPVLDNGCKQGAMFHMQEWKKIWGYGTHGVDPLDHILAKDSPQIFSITTEGIKLL